ncbi:hypothetical protein LY90DRAFT_672774 [Neocallimastix californiae]|uniref:Uncharacterized protein n=1 Tax=Neocallimastix californiae TaxID=1754190 RepID=A0A1Y2BRZ6_9FUNG|nr:hypothetical protein LY90DRAFT_672774 [Neocallimastix californiae]|eukprot:ORY37510.1 hypothetical protein LY90DRAFT_672774 [Neocallimastix californiae]
MNNKIDENPKQVIVENEEKTVHKAKRKNSSKNLNSASLRKNKKSNVNNQEDDDKNIDKNIKLENSDENTKINLNKEEINKEQSEIKNEENDKEKMEIDSKNEKNIEENEKFIQSNNNNDNLEYIENNNIIDNNNSLNSQEKQYLNYQVSANSFQYNTNNSLNNNISNSFSSSISSVYGNGSRPELATINLYDPSIYENNSYNSNISSSVNSLYPMKKETEILNSVDINNNNNKNNELISKYSNINKNIPLTATISNEYYGNISNSTSYIDTSSINNNMFSSDMSNSMDLLYNDINNQFSSSKSSIKNTEDSIIKDDVDKWVKFPLDNDISNISSLVYMINKDCKNKSKDNINANKNITYPNKKELNDNSIGCCNPNMEYMYKMRKDYDQKSNILPNETYNMYNNQKNIPYYKNENEIDKDDKLKRKRNNIYQYNQTENEYNNIKTPYRSSSQIMFSNNPQMVQPSYNVPINGYPMNYPISMVQKNYIHPNKRQKLPIYNGPMNYNDNSVNSQKNEQVVQDPRQQTYYQQKQSNEVYSNSQTQYNQYYNYNSVKKYNYSQNHNQNVPSGSYQQNYRNLNNKNQMMISNHLSPNTSSIQFSPMTNMNNSSNYQIMMMSYQNNRNLNQNPYVTPNPSMSLSNSSSSSNLLSCDTSYMNQNGNNNLRMRLQRKLILRLQQKEEMKGLKQEISYMQNENKMRMNNNYIYNSTYENLNQPINNNMNSYNTKYYNRKDYSNNQIINNKYKYIYENSVPNEISTESINNYKSNEMMNPLIKKEPFNNYSQTLKSTDQQINNNIIEEKRDNEIINKNEKENKNKMNDEKNNDINNNKSSLSPSEENENNNTNNNNINNKLENYIDKPIEKTITMDVNTNNKDINKSVFMEYNSKEEQIDILNNQCLSEKQEKTCSNNEPCYNLYSTLNNDKTINSNDDNILLFNSSDEINNNSKSTENSGFSNIDNLSESSSKDSIKDNIQKRLKLRMMVKDKNYNTLTPMNTENENENDSLKETNSSQLMSIDQIQTNTLSQDQLPLNMDNQLNSLSLFMIDNDILDIDASLNIKDEKNNNDKATMAKDSEKLENQIKNEQYKKEKKLDNYEEIKKEEECKNVENKIVDHKDNENACVENKNNDIKSTETKDISKGNIENKDIENKNININKENEIKNENLNSKELKTKEINKTKIENDKHQDEKINNTDLTKEIPVTNISVSDYINLSSQLDEPLAQSFLFNSSPSNEIITNPDCYLDFSYPINNKIDKKDTLPIESTNPTTTELTQLETNNLLYSNDENWYSNNEDYFSKLSTTHESWPSEEITNLWINPQKKWNSSNIDENINSFTETK